MTYFLARPEEGMMQLSDIIAAGRDSEQSAAVAQHFSCDLLVGVR